jgi:hypothetical protein
MTIGTDFIAVERQRQIEVEGWTPEHDAEHVNGELAQAASCYALIAAHGTESYADDQWPWHSVWWKPSNDPIRNLVKAGALIAAEIDRLEDERPTQ